MTLAAGGMGVVEALRHWAQHDATRTAIATGATAVTYGTLLDECVRLAAALSAHGVREGDRVAILIENSPAFVYSWIATQIAGAVAVPLSPRSPEAVLERVFEDCSPVTAVTEHGVEPGRRRPAQAPPPDDALAALVYTSGTTGLPKGVMLTRRNVVAIADAGQALLNVSDSDRIGIVVPLFHLYGLREIDLAVRAGATLVIPADGRFPGRTLACFHAAGVTGISAVPSILALFLARHRDQLALCGERLRYLTIGTAPLPATALSALRELLPATRIVITYGMTEASRVCWMDVTDSARPFDPARIGRPYRGVDLDLVEESEGAGRLTVRSGMVMAGYWNRAAATARAFTERGALLTPDWVCVDPDGTLRLLGRVDDVINCGGQKVSPVEIEEVLSAHPAVHEVVAFGVLDPDGVLGEVVRTVIVTRPGTSVEGGELRVFAAARLEPHKVPRFIDFVDEIPRGLLGKAQRARLRGQA